MKNIIVAFCVSLLLAACVAPREPVETSGEGKPAEQTVSTTPVVELGTTTGPVVTTTGMTESAKAAMQQGLQDKSVYFDFDQFTVKPEYRPLLQQHADILKAHPQDTVTLEGNSDERGSSEYNLALGSKRANVVKTQLMLMGIAGSRIQEASYGEEKPRAECHDESCWQQNRRVDFEYRSN